MSTKPYKFQKKGVKRLVYEFKGRGLLADEMGLGKTLSALMVHKELYCKPTIIICPAYLKYQWQVEAAKYDNIRTEILETLTPKRRNLVRPADLIIVNYDILARRRGAKRGWIDYLLELNPDLVVLDEIQYVGNPSSLRSKACKKLCKKSHYVLGLSGTPFMSKIIQLWAPLNMIRPDLFPSLMRFGWKYSYPKREFGKWNFKGARNLKKLRKKLKHVMVRRLKIEVAKELPEKVRTVIPVDIDNRKEYQYAERDLIGWLWKVMKKDRSRVMRAARAERLVRFGYLKRLAAAGKIRVVLKSIEDFLEASDEKILVFSIHKFMIKAIQEHFGDQSIRIDGSIRGRKRQHAIDAFLKRDKIRICNGNIQAAGVGWNAQSASRMTRFTELPWTPGEVNQAIDRVHRIGQTRLCFSDFLVAHDTIEERLCQILQDRQNIFSEALDGDGGEELNIMDELTHSLVERRR